jgi:hypothetical protein
MVKRGFKLSTNEIDAWDFNQYLETTIGKKSITFYFTEGSL